LVVAASQVLEKMGFGPFFIGATGFNYFFVLLHATD